MFPALQAKCRAVRPILQVAFISGFSSRMVRSISAQHCAAAYISRLTPQYIIGSSIGKPCSIIYTIGFINFLFTAVYKTILARNISAVCWACFSASTCFADFFYLISILWLFYLLLVSLLQITSSVSSSEITISPFYLSVAYLISILISRRPIYSLMSHYTNLGAN